MGLLELAHVDGDDVLLTAIECLAERQSGLGLAHTGRAGEQEDTDRLVGIVEPGTRGLDARGDHLQGMTLTDDPFVERLGQLEDGLDLVLDHAPDRDAGPVGDHRGDRLGIDAGQDQRTLALHGLQLDLQVAQTRQCISALRIIERCRVGRDGCARGQGIRLGRVRHG